MAPDVSPQPEDSGGPSILSRGGFASVRKGSENAHLRPYAGVDLIYDGGLGTVSVDSQGRLNSINAYGVSARYGVAGVKDWKQTELEMDYRGGFRHYNSGQYFDGADNSLLLSVRHEASRRVAVEFSEEAALYQRSYSLPASMGSSYNTLSSGLTGNELFDTPTGVLMSMGRVTFQRTARMSMSAAGAGFLVRRRSQALAGLTGYFASGDVAYRLNRFSTIGVDYSFTHFDFTGQFGSSDMHGVSVDYSVRFNKRWEMAIRAGGYRVRVLRLGLVTLDPAIALLLGQSQGVEIVDRTIYAPNGDIRLTRAFRRGSWSAGYSRTMLPGNGVYLMSKSDSAQTSVSYNGWRRVALFGQASFTKYSAISQTLGRYRGIGAGGGLSAQLSRSFSLVARANVQRREVTHSSLSRVAPQLTVGIAWSPGDYPLAIW